MSKFYIVFSNQYQQGPFATLREAAEARKVSGDLVCTWESGEFRTVHDDESWLFDWERYNQDAYAYRAIQYARGRERLS